MSRAPWYAVAFTMLAILTPSPAHAQAPGAPRPSTARSRVTLRGFGEAGVTVFSATQSFKAILGRPSGLVLGGGVELGLPKHLILSVAATRFRRTGHRAFVFEGEVFELDVPTTITVTPLEVTAGYRFANLGRLAPYAGGGIGWHKYDETSAHSTDADDVHKTFTGYHALGGAEVPLTNWIAAAVEAQWAVAPNALGQDSSGVSSAYNERDLGGFTFRLKVVVGR